MVACGLDLAGVDPLSDAPEAGVPDGSFDVVGRDVTPDAVGPSAEAGGDVEVIDSGTDADADSGIDDASDGNDASDATSDAGDAGADGGPPITTDVNGCPKGRGPDMAKSGTLCVDKTEVTRAQYTVFLEHDRPDTADAGPDAGAAPECKKLAHTPGVWPQVSGPDTTPIVHVDWCDADAFCRWSGKILCGASDGSPLMNDPGHLNKAGKDAWYSACSKDDTLTYPYGDTYLAAFCNLGSGAPAPAGSASNLNCTGGYTGLVDMVGNVWEHVNGCMGPMCIARGGSFRTAQAMTTTCKNTIDVKRTDRFDDMGIRCCVSLP